MRRPGLILFLWVLLLALCAWPFTVKAAGTVAQGNGGANVPTWRIVRGDAGGTIVRSSPQLTCQANFAYVNSLPAQQQSGTVFSCGTFSPANGLSNGLAVATTTTYTCLINGVTCAGGTFTIEGLNSTTSAGCPANSTLAGGTCTCNVNYYPNSSATECITTVGTSTEACQQVADQRNAAADPRVVSEALTPPVQISTCVRFAGCSLRGMTAALNFSGLSYTVWGPYVVDGTCSSSAVGTAAAGIECPTGQVQGTVNGQTVCVPSATQTSTGTSETTAPAGAGSAPAGTVVGSKQTNTTCTGAGCTTVTTTRDASGAVTAVTSETKPRESFCAENPEVSICEESVFTNSCASGAASIACTGDAIQCAMAREQHTRNCQLFEGTHDTRTVAENALNGVPDPSHPGADGNVSSVAIDEMIDRSPIIGAGSCPADVSYAIPILGTMVVPWSNMCSWLELMGTILVAAAGVTWLFIVFGSKGV